MKRTLLTFAIAGLVIGCKKVPEGGNKDVIKMEHGAVRYDDDHQGGGASHGAEGESAHASKTTVDIDINGVKISGNQNGLEDKLAQFLAAGKYDNADDAALKDTWYDFDNVKFKMGSANQLEAGSEAQLQNLAQILKAYPNVKIKIGGYTDKTGDEAVNKKISQQRADFIKSELTKLGVGAQVVGAEGYGSQFAKVPADASDEERASDRRMSARLTK